MLPAFSVIKCFETLKQLKHSCFIVMVIEQLQNQSHMLVSGFQHQVVSSGRLLEFCDLSLTEMLEYQQRTVESRNWLTTK